MFSVILMIKMKNINILIHQTSCKAVIKKIHLSARFDVLTSRDDVQIPSERVV
jgi:hypothetical protein